MNRPTLGHILGYTALTVILAAGAAQSLAGSNAVTTDDIVDESITTPDLKVGSSSGSKASTGADTNESTLGPRYYEWTWHHAAGAPLNAKVSIESIAGPATVVPVSGSVTNHTGISAACPDHFAANGFFDVPDDADDIPFGSVLSGKDFHGTPWGLTQYGSKSKLRRTLAASESLHISLATACYASLWPVPAASVPSFDVAFVLAVYPTESNRSSPTDID